MEKLIEQFLEHLRYERNVSAHTLRNYASDLEQFLDFLDQPAPAEKQSPVRKGASAARPRSVAAGALPPS